jgi:hypothetical protein
MISGTTELRFEPNDKHIDEDSGEAIAMYDVTVNGEKTGVSEIVHSKGRDVKRVYRAMASPDDKAPTVHDTIIDALKACGHEVRL